MLTPRSYLFSRHFTTPTSASPSSSETNSPRNPTSTSIAIHSKQSLVNRRPESSAGHRLQRPGRDAPQGMSSVQATTTLTTSPPRVTTSDPVVIPVRGHHEPFRESPKHVDLPKRRRMEERQNSNSSSRRRPRDVHSPDNLPPAVAALLAVTSIPLPRPRPQTLQRTLSSEESLTIDTIFQPQRDFENDLTGSYGKSPMDVLLSPPEEPDEEDIMSGDSGLNSYISSMAFSAGSTPSLEETSIRDTSLSPGNPLTPAPRGKRNTPTRNIQSLSSPPQASTELHPLSTTDFDIEELDFRVFQRQQHSINAKQADGALFVTRRRSAFKSNLTASLRALRSAARSISNITAPMIPPDDFLTRSIISIDPRIPFTDERMPPILDETPTPALRRYLNPTTNAPIEAHVPSSLAQATRPTKCTASIQLQTYRISKTPQPDALEMKFRRSITSTPEEVFAEVASGPVARQRDMRENSDFIRIAVMEMMMRKHGKLDEKMPGRAKWALPPRQPSTKAYEIGEGGTPVRWIAISA